MGLHKSGYLWARASKKNLIFAFYGLSECSIHLCETERENGRKKEKKKNTRGGHSSSQGFIAVGTMSSDDVICALQAPHASAH